MKFIEKNVSNIFGWKTRRKIVVFEVDDFGTSRPADDATVNRLEKQGLKIDFFAKYDRMASPEDLSDLFEALTSVRDGAGNHAVLTPLTIVANPDFGKIEASDFTEYHYEPFFETLDRRFGKTVREMWGQGITSGIFQPEFHGREHFHVATWMDALQKRQTNAHLAFAEGIPGIFDSASGAIARFGAAFDYEEASEWPQQQQILSEGIALFKEQLGYEPCLFTPPNSVFPVPLESALVDNGIRFMTVAKRRRIPLGEGRYGKKSTSFGTKTPSGLTYSPRNCQFEPHNPRYQDAVGWCLSEIATAFRWHAPAIVSSHRINFVNQQQSANGQGTKKLATLLRAIVNRWPDVEFMSARDLYLGQMSKK